MNEIRIGVAGIANTQMKTALKNALEKIDGVQSVDIDKTLGEVEIGYNPPAEETQLRSCIEKTGFNLNP